jgi:hypothetical protein
MGMDIPAQRGQFRMRAFDFGDSFHGVDKKWSSVMAKNFTRRMGEARQHPSKNIKLQRAQPIKQH